MQKEARDFHRGLWGKIEKHTFPDKEAFKLIGEIGVVQGTIARVTIGMEKIYLHFGSHRQRDFTGIIYRNILQSLDLPLFFTGRNIKIYGVVKNNQRPTIIISAPSQMDILD